MNKKILLYVLLGVLILFLLAFTFFPNMGYAIKDSGFRNSENEDICSPPEDSGYTEESWREHMSHHPNIYRDCLN